MSTVINHPSGEIKTFDFSPWLGHHFLRVSNFCDPTLLDDAFPFFSLSIFLFDLARISYASASRSSGRERVRGETAVYSNEKQEKAIEISRVEWLRRWGGGGIPLPFLPPLFRSIGRPHDLTSRSAFFETRQKGKKDSLGWISPRLASPRLRVSALFFSDSRVYHQAPHRGGISF